MCAQGESVAQSQSAVKKSLMSIPHLHLSEHQASALCMLGSLQHIASSSVAEILDATDLNQSQYALTPHPASVRCLSGLVLLCQLLIGFHI